MKQSAFPFKLTAEEMLPILEAATGTTVARFTADWQPIEQGSASGDKGFCSFRYTPDNGLPDERVMFVKRCVWKGRSEAVDYRYLTARGVPMPHLFGALQDESGAEVVFLEPLTAIGFKEDDESEWRSMLTLLARFNACEITTEYASHLHGYEQVGTTDGSLWITGLNSQPTNEEIEAGLRASGVAHEQISPLLQRARILFDRVEAQPQGLLHQDFLPDNFGWRGRREEMTVFDVHKNALGPRFADVAPYLAVPDWSKRAFFLDAPDEDGITHRQALSQHYLDEYRRFGGLPVTLPAFDAETSALFWAHKVSCLSWFAEQQPPRAREVIDYLSRIPAGS